MPARKGRRMELNTSRKAMKPTSTSSQKKIWR
jgi:hypothetical protein